MELKHIKYFIVLAEELSFSKAADKLHMSQSPLSRHIKTLEEELNAQLFYRNTRQVQLTSAGKLFYKEAKTLLSEVDGLAHKLKSTSLPSTTAINLGFIRSAMLLFLPDLLHTFKQTYSDTQVNITEINDEEVLKKYLLEGQVDIAFMHSIQKHPDLQYHRVANEPIKVVLPLGHPLASGEAILLNELKAENFIFFPREQAPLLYDSLMYECKEKANFQPNVLLEANPQQVMVELVMRNLGVTFAAASMEKMFEGKVVFRNIANSDLFTFSVDMVWPSQNIDATLQSFITFAEGKISSLQRSFT